MKNSTATTVAWQEGASNTSSRGPGVATEGLLRHVADDDGEREAVGELPMSSGVVVVVVVNSGE